MIFCIRVPITGDIWYFLIDLRNYIIIALLHFIFFLKTTFYKHVSRISVRTAIFNVTQSLQLFIDRFTPFLILFLFQRFKYRTKCLNSKPYTGHLKINKDTFLIHL